MTKKLFVSLYCATARLLSGKDSAFSPGIDQDDLITNHFCSIMLRQARAESGRNMAYVLYLYDIRILIYYFNFVCVLLSLLRRKKFLCVELMHEPYYSRRLYAPLSFGNRQYTQGAKQCIEAPHFLSSVRLTSECTNNTRFGAHVDLIHLSSTIRQLDISRLEHRFEILFFCGVMWPSRKRLVDAIESDFILCKYGNYYGRKTDKLKRDFQQKHLFLLCPENMIRKGYVSEKILEAYASGFIPITWANPLNLSPYLNEHAFINLHGLDESSIKVVVSRAMSDTSYLQALYEQPIFKNPTDIMFLVHRIKLDIIECLYA